MIYFQNDTDVPSKQYVYFDDDEIFNSVLRYLATVGISVETGGLFSSPVAISKEYRNMLLINSKLYGSELAEIRSQFSVFDELRVVETNASGQYAFMKHINSLNDIFN